MKNALILLLALITTTSWTQNAFEATNVKKSQVPKAVKVTHDKFYPTSTVTQWKEHTWSDKMGNENIQYIAWFSVADFKGKAYYRADGTGKHSVVYFSATEVPSQMRKSLKEDYPAYRIKKAEKVRILDTNEYAYNVHLKNGSEDMNVWVDLAGNEVEGTRLVKSLNEAYQATRLAR